MIDVAYKIINQQLINLYRLDQCTHILFGLNVEIPFITRMNVKDQSIDMCILGTISIDK